MLERDREEIEKLIERKVGDYRDHAYALERHTGMWANPEGRADLLNEIGRMHERAEYYQGLLERYRAHNHMLDVLTGGQ